MAKEIERKYLCKFIPEGLVPIRIAQGYIHIDKQKQVRVRLIRDTRKAYMCVKYMGFLERNEFEAEIDYNEALQLYNLCDYKLEKNRYKTVFSAGVQGDIDQYDDGTIIIEIELPHLQSKFDTSIYPFIGENVDGVYKYCNYYYAGYPESDYK